MGLDTEKLSTSQTKWLNIRIFLDLMFGFKIIHVFSEIFLYFLLIFPSLPFPHLPPPPSYCCSCLHPSSSSFYLFINIVITLLLFSLLPVLLLIIIVYTRPSLFFLPLHRYRRHPYSLPPAHLLFLLGLNAELPLHLFSLFYFHLVFSSIFFFPIF